MKRHLLFLTFILTSFSLLAEEHPGQLNKNKPDHKVWFEGQIVSSKQVKPDKRFSGGMFFIKDEKGEVFDNYLRVGLVALFQIDGDATNDYTGGEISAGFSTGGRVSLYAGGGLVIGEANACDPGVSTCDKSTVLGVFPEAGVRINAGDEVFVTAFIRSYLLTKEVPDFVGTGMSFGLRF